MKGTILLWVVFLIGNTISAQVKMGDTPRMISPASILELESTDQGLLLPRLTTTQRDLQTSWVEGHIIYNSSEKCFQFFDGTTWDCLTAGNSSTSTVVSSANGILFGSSRGVQLNAHSPNYFIKTSDGGFFHVQTEMERGGENLPEIPWGGYNAIASKFDANMNLVWSKGLGTNTDDYGVSAAEMANGNFVVTGSVSGNDGDFGAALPTSLPQDYYSEAISHAYFVVLDPLGNIVRTKIMKEDATVASVLHPSVEVPRLGFRGVILSNGELALCGLHNDDLAAGSWSPINILTVNLTSGTITNRTELTSISFDYETQQHIHSIPSGGFLVATGSFASKSRLYKYSNNLTLEWSKEVSGASGTVAVDDANGFIYWAYGQLTIQQLDFSGNVLQTASSSYGPTKHIFDLLIDNNGDLVCLGGLEVNASEVPASFDNRGTTTREGPSGHALKQEVLAFSKYQTADLTAIGRGKIHSGFIQTYISAANIEQAVDGNYFLSVTSQLNNPSFVNRTHFTKTNTVIVELDNDGNRVVGRN